MAFTQRAVTAVMPGWDPAQTPTPTPTAVEVGAAEPGASPRGRGPVGAPSSHAAGAEQDVAVSPGALGVGSPRVELALEFGALRRARRVAGAGAGGKGEMQTLTQAPWRGAAGSFSSQVHFQRCCEKAQVSLLP